jgi:hypothetical protein
MAIIADTSEIQQYVAAIEPAVGTIEIYVLEKIS